MSVVVTGVMAAAIAILGTFCFLNRRHETQREKGPSTIASSTSVPGLNSLTSTPKAVFTKTSIYVTTSQNDSVTVTNSAADDELYEPVEVGSLFPRKPLSHSHSQLEGTEEAVYDNTEDTITPYIPMAEKRSSDSLSKDYISVSSQQQFHGVNETTESSRTASGGEGAYVNV